MSEKARRRSHKKSRTGCHACKQRHVRCDEERPQCSSCNKRRAICIYALPSHKNGVTGEPPCQGSVLSDYDKEADAGDATEHTIAVPNSVLDILSEFSREALSKLCTASLDPFSGFCVSLTGSNREQLIFCLSEPIYIFLTSPY